MPRSILSVTVVGEYRLRLSFDDGFSGVVDLADRVGTGGVFNALTDPAFFRLVRVDDDIGSICWPNGADLCPDVLRREASAEATD